MVPIEDYTPLLHHLLGAYKQASEQKGSERHNVNHVDFKDQVIIRGNKALGSIDGCLYQVIKKIEECKVIREKFGDEAAIAEIYGSIVYAAAACILIEDGVGKTNENK